MFLKLIRTLLFPAGFLFCLTSQAQTTDIYTSATTWNVPAGVSTISIKVYGGGGGTGGQDCGAGCTNTAASNAGYVEAAFSVTAGDVIGIYPGGKGADGGNSVTNSGGGAAGVSPYNTAYNGGRGGDAGPSGSSGGGGGGGAASVLTINAVISIVSGGAGGGGGMANMAGSGYPGNSTTSPNGTSNTGGDGSKPGGDGGGGGGGGGGQYGSVGGDLHAAGGEQAGDGGYLGSNFLSGASSVTTNGNTSWTSAGRIEITYVSTLPVTWLFFNVARQSDNSVLLSWATTTEVNTRNFVIQRSFNGDNWLDIGMVAAAGNSQVQNRYQFTDKTADSKTVYYRLVQRDIDGHVLYSRIASAASISASGIKIYPNPVKDGKIFINIRETSVASVYNMNGELIMKIKLAGGDNQLDVRNLTKGTYILKVNEGQVSFAVQ